MDSKKTNGLSFTVKLAIIAFIMASTLAYSIVQKRKIDKLTSEENHLILKEMPEFSLPAIEGRKDSELVTNQNIFSKGHNVTLVHFWGTWCAPCEAELPDFLEFISKLSSKDIRVILLAVQDDEKKINKFLKRFGDLPSNVTVVHDPDGKSMMTFGTVKVPETFLFAKNGKSLNKYVGPQDWLHKSYLDRMNFYINSVDSDQITNKVESH